MASSTCDVIDARSALRAHRVHGPAFQTAAEEIRTDRCRGVRHGRGRSLHGRHVRPEHGRARRERVRRGAAAAASTAVQTTLDDGRLGAERVPDVPGPRRQRHRPVGLAVPVLGRRLLLVRIERPPVLDGRRVSASGPAPDRRPGTGFRFSYRDRRVLAMPTHRHVCAHKTRPSDSTKARGQTRWRAKGILPCFHVKTDGYRKTDRFPPCISNGRRGTYPAVNNNYRRFVEELILF